MLEAVCRRSGFLLVSIELTVAPLHTALVHVYFTCSSLLIEQLLICKGAAATFNRVKIRLLMQLILPLHVYGLVSRR